jgi:hypothetical protein
MEAEQFINNAAAELEMVEAQLRDNEARGAALRARGDGLRFLIQYGQEAQGGTRAQSAIGTPQPVTGAASTVPGIEAAQTDRVLKALTEIGRTAMTGEVTDRVNASGRALGLPDLAHEQVRSSLGYLLRKRPPRVERVRPGVWRLPKAAPSPTAFTPPLLSVAGSNGSQGES